VGTPRYRDLPDRLYGVEGGWSLRQCDNPACDLLWQDPMIAPADIASAYAHYYTHPASAEATQRAWPYGVITTIYAGVARLLPWMRQRHRIEWMYLNGHVSGRLLEIGCGSGSRLAMFRAAGWRVTGQEVDNAAAEHAARRFGLDVIRGPIEDWNDQGQRYDAVVLNHVLEHTHDPTTFINRCFSLLDTGGRLIVTTPNTHSFGHQAYGRDWLGLDQPRHLHLFNPQAAARLVERAGLTDVTICTSAARAQAVGRLTVDQIRGVSPRGPGNPDLRRDLWALNYQRRAWRAWRRDPGCGDELVILAKRS
jgi:SAM-dependent methyltransferase